MSSLKVNCYSNNYNTWYLVSQKQFYRDKNEVIKLLFNALFQRHRGLDERRGGINEA